MDFNANMFNTQSVYTYETKRRDSINDTGITKEVLEVIKNLESKVNNLTNEVGIFKTIMCKQTVLLEELVKASRPHYTDLKIFPINSLEELNSAEKQIDTMPASEVISYMKIWFDRTILDKALHKMIGDNILLSINWDGSKNKVALNKYRLFNLFFFEALKDSFSAYPEYEKAMKLAFRKSKATLYRQTYTLKSTAT